MSTESFLNRVAKAQAEALAAFEVQRDVAKVLPINGYTDIYPHSYKADATVVYKDKTHQDAAMLMDLYKPVTLVRHEDSCLSFFPADRLTNREKENGETSTVAPFKLDIDFYDTKWEWYTFQGKFLVKIEVRIKDTDCGVRSAHVYYNSRSYDVDSRVKEYHWECKHNVKKDPTVTKFASGAPENANHFTLTWPSVIQHIKEVI